MSCTVASIFHFRTHNVRPLDIFVFYCTMSVVAHFIN